MLHWEVALAAPWFEAWQEGRLRTNEPAVDGLLAEFHPTGVEDTFAESLEFGQWVAEQKGYRYFTLTLAQPVNVGALRERLRVTSAHFQRVEPDWLDGADDRITFAHDGEARRYTFSGGWDNYPPSSIQRRCWEFTLAPDGAIRVREYGEVFDPLQPCLAEMAGAGGNGNAPAAVAG